MQLKTVTAAKDTGIPGIEFVKTDKAITEIIIGGRLRIKRGESYNNSLVCLIEQPFEEAKRFRTTGKIDGFDPKVSYFENMHEAQGAANDLASKGAETAVDEVVAQINDDGEIVGIVNDPKAIAPVGDDLPF